MPASTSSAARSASRRVAARLARTALIVACLSVLSAPAGCRTAAPPPSGPSFEDDAITARVKTALLNDQQIGAMKIDVTTSNGVVTLSGTVNSRADEARALTLAQQAEGVKRVVSLLKIGATG
jgi:hyperosmotically inducible protein